MILQGSLQIEYNNESFVLIVKTFLKNDIYYFFVGDKEKGKSLLGGETLELTFTDSFCSYNGGERDVEPKIPAEIVSAIEKVLLENKQLWYY